MAELEPLLHPEGVSPRENPPIVIQKDWLRYENIQRLLAQNHNLRLTGQRACQSVQQKKQFPCRIYGTGRGHYATNSSPKFLSQKYQKGLFVIYHERQYDLSYRK
jgi:hypothetical protein